jgi:low temperature requirement protein LtrA
MALCCFLTGKLLSFPPLVFGAIISGFLALLTTLLNFDYNILICGLAILVSYIIPGYLLRIRYKKIQPAY